MTSDPLFYLMIASVLLVLAILLYGIAGFGRGGDFNKKQANKVMRWRLIAQFVAVLIILLFVYLRREGGA